jgi:3-oxoacyl-[acyl-carrier-protein] synthase-1
LEGELQLEGIAAGCENATIESEEPLRGDGLTQVIRQTLLQAACRMQDVSYRLADLNGEHYRFKEFILAMGRFPRQAAAEKFDVWHPIEYVGDVGAAIGPLLLAVALDAGRKRYAPGRNVLCTLGNDGGERAALLLSYRKGGENAYE